MSASRLKVRAVACLLALAAPFIVSAADPLGNFDQRLLFAHNRERAALESPPLQWNAALERTAQRWADYLAADRSLRACAGKYVRAAGRKSLGRHEGLLCAGADGRRVGAREALFFRPGTFPNNSTTGRMEDIGHYTQLVWRATRQVGCAHAISREEDILVCRYAEAGNYLGEQPF